MPRFSLNLALSLAELSVFQAINVEITESGIGALLRGILLLVTIMAAALMFSV